MDLCRVCHVLPPSKKYKAGRDRSIKILMVRLRFNLFALHKIKTEQFVPSYVLHFARNFLCCTQLRRLTSSRSFAVTEMKRFSEGLRNNKTSALSLFNIPVSCSSCCVLPVPESRKPLPRGAGS